MDTRWKTTHFGSLNVVELFKAGRKWKVDEYISIWKKATESMGDVKLLECDILISSGGESRKHCENFTIA